MPDEPSREYPERPIVGVGAVVFSDRGVLLIQRGKPPRLGSWSLPGGAQELGETVFESAKREVLEEAGLSIDLVGLLDVVDSITKDDDGRIQYHYTLVDVAGDVRGEVEPISGGDAADARWVHLEDIDAYDLWSETERMIRLGHERWLDYRSRNDVDTEL